MPVVPAGAQEGAPAVPGDARTPATAAPVARDGFGAAIERARSFAPLETLQIAQDGETLVDEGFRGNRTDRAANIKSASKSVVSALVGIAIDKGLIRGPDQPIADFLHADFPENPDPRLTQVTVGHLLSMQAGLERTSGGNYGAWISSRNWVRDALRRPFVTDPGGSMLYSTGSTHLLSAILTKASGRTTLALARDWLGPAGVRVTDWERDPQGIYLGGNQMAMTPRSLLAFGELYRRGGLGYDGTRILSEDWIAQSWTPRTTSRFHDGRYGYGWFIDTFAGHAGRYGWGYGGQMIYVIPDLALTVAITSAEDQPSARSGYVQDLHRLVSETIIPAAEARRATEGKS
ncbi:serine hydrolase domain-containing protein [Aureimonas phyllosphaerae]|uniref:CubicO group peptidase (Beta-lactamase class C family) n=1 Tax=Aureimonas phyllosphaerae TaxID=1166078 RepID=A0A7W6FSX6_9HYPH|nr:serine hydrolase [Aureimonas phyllosphaerae]MBB3934411.1 CubicO group peptidase (beta-lactamase class C family) [Aureimonas phyllosphaerae]MBB3958373.1 CubicO group peptidase (beta-lactamase class C family) [Aureimonas phyllosphaerae]